MINEISDFIYAFKNNIIEADELVQSHEKTINDFANSLKEEGIDKEYEENFLTILGYTYRLDDVKQRVFFTFQEAVYAIDLDKLMRNEESLKLNCIVYILVMDFLIAEYKTGKVDEDIKQKAIQSHKQMQDKKSQEDKKYHMYQY